MWSIIYTGITGWKGACMNVEVKRKVGRCDVVVHRRAQERNANVKVNQNVRFGVS